MTSEADSGGTGGPRISTPDQRVRVFVSSTLKEVTRARDRVNADRRRLPMVRIDKPYTFEGPAGQSACPTCSTAGRSW